MPSKQPRVSFAYTDKILTERSPRTPSAACSSLISVSKGRRCCSNLFSPAERRQISEELTEEELAVFDLLTKPTPKLTKAEEIEDKEVAPRAPNNAQAEKLVLDWKEKPDRRAGLWVATED